jgi:hypothetical protein
MGDRVVIQVVDAPCAAYLHWGGETAIESIKRAIPSMRCGDPDYSAARLIASLCNDMPGTNRGVGVLPKVGRTPVPAESHGDAGIVLYDCNTGKATFHYGYLARQHPEPMQLDAPPE